MKHPPIFPNGPQAIPTHSFRWLKWVSVLAVGLCLAAGPGLRCGKAPTPAIGQEVKVPVGPASSLRQKIEDLTGGHTRIVWARDHGSGKDTFALGSDLILMGFDTRLPSAEMPLTPARGNYSRPMLSPDGGTIIFSRRTRSNAEKEPSWASEILSLPWQGSTPQPMRAGYAVEVWRDPDTRLTWVYAFTTLRSGVSSNPEGYRLFRFPINQPDKEEIIWEKGLMSGDNIQLNRAGTYASGLIPWPNAGAFDFASGQFIRYRNGCWPSLAPDDSGVIWVFDGTHKNLRFFLPGIEGNWRVPMDQAEGMKGKAGYHPRWSNHPRLLAFTGPHPVEVSKGSGKVSVILARLNSNLTELEGSLSLRNSSGQPDCYPDLWVAGGEAENLDLAHIGPKRLRGQASSANQKTVKWEVAPEGLCFVWERATANNLVPAESRESSVTPHRHARFGPRFDMLTEGGSFSVDPASSAAVRRALSGGPWHMEMAVTPLSPGNAIPQVIFRAGPSLEIQQSHHDFIVRYAGKEWQLGAGLSPGRTTHLALGSGPALHDPPVVWMNGQSQDVRPVEIEHRSSLTPATDEEVKFGSRGDHSAAWTGRIEAITFHASPFSAEKAASHAAWWRRTLADATPPTRTIVRAKLIAASPRATPDSIGTYRRSWTSARYEKVALVSGPDPGPIFGVAHWTILDGKPLHGPPNNVSEEVELTLEPMNDHPEMESEHGSEEILMDSDPLFLDVSEPAA